MSKLRQGVVVSIRVNPANCAAAYDIVDAAGMYRPGMSFAQVVSTALSVAINTLQQQRLIPIKDSFEVIQAMNRIPKGPERVSIPTEGLVGNVQLATPVEATSEVPLRENIAARRWARKIDELEAKRDADPVNFSESEQRELNFAMDMLIQTTNSVTGDA